MRTLVVALAVLAVAPAAARASTVTIDVNIQTRVTYTLRYTAAPGEANDVSSFDPGDGLHVVDTGAPLTAGSECRALSAHEAVCRRPSQGLTWDLGDGDDRMTGSPLPDVIRGGPGSDQVAGGDGGDVIVGDEINPYADRLDGGPGDDTVAYDLRTAPVHVDALGGPSGFAGEGDMLAGFEHYQGGAGADTFRLAGDGSAACGDGVDVVENSAAGRDVLLLADCELWTPFPGGYVRVRPRYAGGRLVLRVACPAACGGTVAVGGRRGRFHAGSARVAIRKPTAGEILQLRFAIVAGGRRYSGGFSIRWA